MTVEAQVVNSKRRGREWSRTVSVWGLTILVIAFAAFGGLRLRRWVFEITVPIRFTPDIQRGCFWGLKSAGPEGYLNQYEKMSAEKPEWQDARWQPWLDYAPLRLLVMRQWGAWIYRHDPPDAMGILVNAWQPSYEYNAPVLDFNAAMDGLAAVLGFFLTWLWVRRDKINPPRFCGWWQGLAAALLIWFNPAILISAHGWPTWDEWIIPMYLLAALLASLNLWFFAGVAVGVGAMFKGQQLTVAPVFVIWALVAGNWRGALQWLAGGIFAFAAIVSPWLLSYLRPDQLDRAHRAAAFLPVWMYPSDLYAIRRTVDYPAIAWIGGMILSNAVAPMVLRRWKANRTAWICIAAGVFAFVIWPWCLPRNLHDWWIGLFAGAAASAIAIYSPRRWLPYFLAAVTGISLLMCMSVFHGSNAWWNCAFHYGQIHWPYMIMGDTSNLPGLFLMRFGWSNDVHQIAFHIGSYAVTSKQLFNSIFAGLLPISGIFIGMQARRRSRRILVALTTPWLLFFCFPVQIHERYLLFGAVTAAICVGESIGMALLGVFLSAVTTVMTLQVMLDNGDRDGWGHLLATRYPCLFSNSSVDSIYQVIVNTHPDIAWGVLLATAVFFYVGATFARRERAGN